MQHAPLIHACGDAALADWTRFRRGPHDLASAVFDTWEHYNVGDGQPSLEHWHEDAEYETPAEGPEAAVHRGIDAIASLFASWREVYPDLRVEVKEIKARHNRVFAWVRLTGRGAASGIRTQMELAHVYTMREGKTSRLLECFDRSSALEVAGLRRGTARRTSRRGEVVRHPRSPAQCA